MTTVFPIIREKSSGAVPFGTMFALLLLWFGISVPLVFLGSYFGYRRKNADFPVRINQIPRQVRLRSGLKDRFEMDGSKLHL